MKKNDRTIALFISSVTLSVILTSFISFNFFSWSFERHRNVLSWISQILLVFPFCYFAFIRSFTGMAATLLLFVTSTFWFPVPEYDDPLTLSLLLLEAEWIFGTWSIEKFFVTVVLLAIVAGVAASLWKRRLDIAVLTLFLICIEKLLWEFFFSEDKFSLTGIVMAIVTSLLGMAYAFLASGMKRETAPKEKIKEIV